MTQPLLPFGDDQTRATRFRSGIEWTTKKKQKIGVNWDKINKLISFFLLDFPQKGIFFKPL